MLHGSFQTINRFSGQFQFELYTEVSPDGIWTARELKTFLAAASSSEERPLGTPNCWGSDWAADKRGKSWRRWSSKMEWRSNQWEWNVFLEVPNLVEADTNKASPVLFRSPLWILWRCERGRRRLRRSASEPFAAPADPRSPWSRPRHQPEQKEEILIKANKHVELWVGNNSRHQQQKH